jgi:hypothetical protein
MPMRRSGLCRCALALSLIAFTSLAPAGCGGGVQPGMSTNLDKKPLDPGPPDVQPNMSGPSTAAPAKK